MLASVLRNGASFGLLGTDVLEEAGFDGGVTKYEQIRNFKGDALRFGIIARPDAELSLKLARGEPISIVTSYPNIATEVLSKLGISLADIDVVDGGVEAEVFERRDIDAAFELILSGDSVRSNLLTIVADDLRTVELAKVTKGDSDETN